MRIERTKAYQGLELKEDQLLQVLSPGKLRRALEIKACMGFYAYEGSNVVGFALLRQYEAGRFFLWAFLIDARYQGRGMGSAFLGLLMDTLKQDYAAQVITTTYLFGNEAARRLYESQGFVETDVVCENGVHEVNMALNVNSISI